MTNVIPMFDFNGVRLRGTIIDNQPWFVAKDVCECAGLALGGGPTQHLRMLDKDEKGRGTFPTPGGPQQMTVVSEAGLYKLIQRSSKPEAKAFDRWVRHEVLPSIRRTGGYVMKDANVEAVLKQQPANRALTYSRYPSQRRTGR